MKRLRSQPSDQESIDRRAQQRAYSRLSPAGRSAVDPAKVIEYARKSPVPSSRSIYIRSSGMGNSPILVQSPSPPIRRATKPPRKRSPEVIDVDAYTQQRIVLSSDEDTDPLIRFEMESIEKMEAEERLKRETAEEDKRLMEESIANWRAEAEIRQRYSYPSSPEAEEKEEEKEEKVEEKDEEEEFVKEFTDSPGGSYPNDKGSEREATQHRTEIQADATAPAANYYNEEEEYNNWRLLRWHKTRAGEWNYNMKGGDRNPQHLDYVKGLQHGILRLEKRFSDPQLRERMLELERQRGYNYP